MERKIIILLILSGISYFLFLEINNIEMRFTTGSDSVQSQRLSLFNQEFILFKRLISDFYLYNKKEPSKLDELFDFEIKNNNGYNKQFVEDILGTKNIYGEKVKILELKKIPENDDLYITPIQRTFTLAFLKKKINNDNIVYKCYFTDRNGRFLRSEKTNKIVINEIELTPNNFPKTAVQSKK
jgi:hypothetical protein